MKATGVTNKIVPFIGGPLHNRRGALCRSYIHQDYEPVTAEEAVNIGPTSIDGIPTVMGNLLRIILTEYVPLTIAYGDRWWSRREHYMVWADIPEAQRFAAWQAWTKGQEWTGTSGSA